MNLPLRVGLPGLRVPLRRAALLQHAAAGPPSQSNAAIEKPASTRKLLVERRGPLDVADEVMRVRRVAELPDRGILPAVKSLPLRFHHRDANVAILWFGARLPRQPQRRTAHVGVEVRVDDLSIRRDDLHRHIGDELVRGLVPGGDEEPQLVLLDRPAQRRGEHLNVLDAVGGCGC